MRTVMRDRCDFFEVSSWVCTVQGTEVKSVNVWGTEADTEMLENLQRTKYVASSET